VRSWCRSASYRTPGDAPKKKWRIKAAAKVEGRIPKFQTNNTRETSSAIPIILIHSSRRLVKDGTMPVGNKEVWSGVNGLLAKEWLRTTNLAGYIPF
jgi:hypothetical protein